MIEGGNCQSGIFGMELRFFGRKGEVRVKGGK